MQSICTLRKKTPFTCKKKCKPNAMELAPIAEMQPFFYKDNANERNVSLLSNCRMQLIFCKDNKKDDTMRDRNVKMWMNFSF